MSTFLLGLPIMLPLVALVLVSAGVGIWVSRLIAPLEPEPVDISEFIREYERGYRTFQVQADKIIKAEIRADIESRCYSEMVTSYRPGGAIR